MEMNNFEKFVIVDCDESLNSIYIFLALVSILSHANTGVNTKQDIAVERGTR